ncbi:MAG: response regulator transcription factor [Calditrichaeota bacterium]|nr:response regulator transcription factor [Calditrichota bacterium]
MAFIQTLIIDDEELARNRVKRFLKNYDDFNVIGEAKNGADAINKIKTLKPDLLFLDIQMPDLSGFQVLSQAGMKQFPLIVFVTAFSKFALKAFDFYALDYLVKPFDKERFDRCIRQILLRYKQNEQSDLNKQIMALLAQSESQQHLESIRLKQDAIWITLQVQDVIYFEAYGNYLRVHLENENHLHRQTMNELESQLDPKRFVRIHRSLMVNRAFIKQIKYVKNNEYHVLLINGQELKSGRHYRDQVEKLLVN